VRKCVLSSLKARGKAFPLPTLLTHYKSVSPFSRHVDSSQYRLVKVRTIGRSKHEAVHNAMKSVNLLRGLWSLFATYRSWSVTYSNTPQRKPIGVIHTGPIHTLHLPNGALAENDLYWYEPAYTEDQPIFRPADGWQELDKNRRRATRQLSTLKYGGDLEGILIRYVDALDQPDHNIAFLKMWGILERITNSLGTNYDETINRAVWIYSRDNRQLAKDLLQSLRYRRNQYVHSGDSCTESDQVAYMIKFYLDPHLLNLISNPFNVASIEEYGELLSLPTEIDILDNRKAKLSQALRWLRSSNWGS